MNVYIKPGVGDIMGNKYLIEGFNMTEGFLHLATNMNNRFQHLRILIPFFLQNPIYIKK